MRDYVKQFIDSMAKHKPKHTVQSVAGEISDGLRGGSAHLDKEGTCIGFKRGRGSCPTCSSPDMARSV